MDRTNNINSKPTNTSITSPVRLEANWFVNTLLLNKKHKQLQKICPIFNGIIRVFWFLKNRILQTRVELCLLFNVKLTLTARSRNEWNSISFTQFLFFTWKESYCLPEVRTITACLSTLLHLWLELDFLISSYKNQREGRILCNLFI